MRSSTSALLSPTATQPGRSETYAPQLVSPCSETKLQRISLSSSPAWRVEPGLAADLCKAYRCARSISPRTRPRCCRRVLDSGPARASEPTCLARHDCLSRRRTRRPGSARRPVSDAPSHQSRWVMVRSAPNDVGIISHPMPSNLHTRCCRRRRRGAPGVKRVGRRGDESGSELSPW